MSHDPSTLPPTGERYLPGMAGDMALEHLHRYLLARQLCAGAEVLDIASGEGYGSALLAEVATRVTGVDIAAAAVSHARARYGHERLRFLQGDCADIPLADASVDVVVSFETIEHHDRHVEMLCEIKRVLRPSGVLVISSPDRYVYSDKPGYRNPYHVKELYADEFKALLQDHFPRVRYFGQRVCYGSVVLPEADAAPALSFWPEQGQTRSTAGLHEPMYWLALAGNDELPQLPGGLFEQPADACEPVTRLRAELDDTRAQLAAAEAQRAVAHAQAAERVAAAAAEQAAAQAGRARAEARAAGLAAELASVRVSRSWRLTAPLRALASRVRQVRGGL
jgi:O-antigen biosynthesis protein